MNHNLPEKRCRQVAVAVAVAGALFDVTSGASTARADSPLPAPPLATSAMSVYADALENGWENWSWAAVDLSNPAPVNSGTSSIAVTASPYSALSFHHGAIETQLFSSVTFWINGGSSGGQLLAVKAVLGDGAHPGVTIGPLAANTWQKVVIPLGDLGAANRLDLTNIWVQEVAGVAAPTYYVDDFRLEPAPPPALVNVQIDARSKVRTVDARTFGLNTAIWDGSFATPTTAGLLDELANRALRFPGGSLSNVYHWKTNMSDGQTFEWATSFDAFAGIARATHAQVFITVNYGTGTPEEAADWVRHSNVEMGNGFEYWEVGNENYGSWETDHNTRPQDPVTYATRFAEYARQMKAVDCRIKVGAVIEAGEDDYSTYADEVVVNPRTGASHHGWSSVMLATFQRLGVTPDFVIYHRYEQGPGGENDAYLLGAARGWAGDAGSIRQMLSDYLGPAAASVEIDSTEANSVYDAPGKQSTSLVNGLFLADSVGNILQTEFNSFVWWDLRNSQNAGNNASTLYGWRLYGDYGIVDAATPAAPADRYPTFYVYKLLKHFARGGETVISATTDYRGLGVYAVRGRQGHGLNLLVINKNPTTALAAAITINGWRAAPKAELYSYGIPEDDAARTGSGSADVAHSTARLGGGPVLEFSAPPYSATVIQLRPARRPDRGRTDGDHGEGESEN